MIIKLTFFTLALTVIELFIVPFPFVFIALLLYFQLFDQQEALLLAFFAGLLFDLMLLRPLGTTAMLFMGILLITSLYKRKYEAGNFLFIGISIFVSILLLEYLFSKTIVFAHALFGTIVTVILAKVFSTENHGSRYRIS